MDRLTRPEYPRVRRAGVGDRPVDLPGRRAIVSIDAFEYFGTADSCLPYLAGFLGPDQGRYLTFALVTARKN